MNYRQKIEHFVELTLDVLYPSRLGQVKPSSHQYCHLEKPMYDLMVGNIADCCLDPDEVSKQFVEALPEIHKKLDKDIEALYDGDPAAATILEVVIAYPGFHGIASYRIANVLYKLEVPLIPRIITEYSHSYTGIDIHPGATIGESICIDHGTGVVIGETVVIGNNVKIYQGVTLGALSIPKGKSKEKRHPTIEDNVVIYAQATILGGKTIIGKNSIIGGNVWITSSVPSNSKVIYDGTTLSKQLEIT
jgi:serine O-acetyltransferase